MQFGLDGAHDVLSVWSSFVLLRIDFYDRRSREDSLWWNEETTKLCVGMVLE